VPRPKTQQANSPAYLHINLLNAERQAGKLWIPTFRVFWYDSARESNLQDSDLPCIHHYNFKGTIVP